LPCVCKDAEWRGKSITEGDLQVALHMLAWCALGLHAVGRGVAWLAGRFGMVGMGAAWLARGLRGWLVGQQGLSGWQGVRHGWPGGLHGWQRGFRGVRTRTGAAMVAVRGPYHVAKCSGCGVLAVCSRSGLCRKNTARGSCQGN
jgi:hypothetical protein